MAFPHIDYHLVLEAAGRHADGCPLCAEIARSERDFWESTLFSHVGTEGFQDSFLETNGFCPTHVRDFAARRDGVAVTMLYVPLLRHRRAWIKREERRRYRTASLRGAGARAAMVHRVGLRGRRAESPADRGRRAGRVDCLLCRRIDHWTERFLINLLRHQADDSLRSAIEAGSGLCIPHYRHMARVAGRGRITGRLPGGPERVPRISPWLREFHNARWDAIARAADEAVHEPGGTEWRALLRAVEGEVER